MADIFEMTEHHIANPNAKRPIQRENADVKRVRPVDNFKWTDDAAFVIRSQNAMKGLAPDDKSTGFLGF